MNVLARQQQPTREDLERMEAEILAYLEAHGETSNIDAVAKNALEHANRLVVESAVRRLIEKGSLELTRDYELRVAG